MLASHHHLGVKYDVETKNKGSNTGIDKIEDIVSPKDSREKSKHHQAQQCYQ